ncbi:hypothetical protein BCR42DRAFT_61669 [Absidia repens]|uniref:BHLH domain-containing protein n=1 Tax=Absidia repens TaxID=90262 RepID=A0A1X2ICS2_9FUNG|nr:hypothetical protein BCR42DRAFT_61669 [Absidia repens]
MIFTIKSFFILLDQGTFDYNPTSHSLIEDMDSLMYTQQPGSNDTALTGMVTAAPGTVYLNQNEQGVYTSPNSDMVGSCTTSAQNTLPTMTGSSSSSTMESDTTNMIMTASNSVTTSTSMSTSSPPPSSTWTPSASPSSTSSASLACMNASLLLPGSSTTSSSNDASFLTSLSPSLPMTTNVDAMNYISNNHNTNANNSTGPQQQQQPLDAHQTKSLDYPSPMPTYHQQHHSISNDHMFSPTFMPSSSHRSSLTSITSPQTTSLPTMTTSTSAPTAMMSTNDAQTPSSEFQHSMDFKLSPQPIHETEKDQDSLSINHSQTQSSNVPNTTNTEIRRQIHIQSEQKRRAQIKDGFEDLRNELPSCLNKKMSKVALLQRTVQHIQHLKSTQITILGELERLMNENEHLKKFQENVIQRPGSVKSYQNPNSM